MSHYFPTNSPQSMRSHPLASPLLAPDSMFANLPAALITTCGADPLYSEGRAYAELLESKGIPVEYHEWPGQLHGCATQQIGLSKAPEEIVEVIAGALNRAFA